MTHTSFTMRILFSQSLLTCVADDIWRPLSQSPVAHWGWNSILRGNEASVQRGCSLPAPLQHKADSVCVWAQCANWGKAHHPFTHFLVKHRLCASRKRGVFCSLNDPNICLLLKRNWGRWVLLIDSTLWRMFPTAKDNKLWGWRWTPRIRDRFSNKRSEWNGISFWMERL